MLVNLAAAKTCCKHCDPEFGKSDKGKQKSKFKRQLRRRDNQKFKRDVRNENY